MLQVIATRSGHSLHRNRAQHNGIYKTLITIRLQGDAMNDCLQHPRVPSRLQRMQQA